MTPRRYLIAAVVPAAVLLLCGAPTTTATTATAKAPRPVYVEDHTADWPVAEAVSEWRRAGVSRVHYGKCRAGAECVRAQARPLPGDSAGETALGTGAITLDSSWPYTAARKRQITIHEVGHALGVNHNNAVSGTGRHRVWSCMNAEVQPFAAPCRITAADVRMAKS